MQELPSTAPDRKSLVLSSTTLVPRERTARPPPCRLCACSGWWNGWRRVFAVVDGPERQERWLPRAKCSSCGHGFTVYPDGIYPRRQFQLDVVAAAVAEVALGGATVPATAEAVGASERSVHRWAGWVACLCSVADVCALAARLDPKAPAGAGLPPHDPRRPTRGRAAQVLVALEHLGAALRRRGVAIAVRTGLAFVLAWQHATSGLVLGLVAGARRFSPRMAGCDGGAAA
jgi:hypothetical protein